MFRKINVCSIFIALIICSIFTTTLFAYEQNKQKYGKFQAQGQLQGQAQKQTAKGGDASNNGITISGDGAKVGQAVSWPETPSTAGKEEKSIYSIFGGIGSNASEEHIRINHQFEILSSMLKEELITVEDYKEECLLLYAQLKESNKPQKLLGVLPIAQRGCSVLNICGLLNW